jgi:hypothetical protein
VAKRYTGQGGPNNRPLRYPMRRIARLSKEADADLLEMAKEKDTKPGTLLRRAIMKDIYIWKNEKKRREEAAAVLDGQLSLTDDKEKES